MNLISISLETLGMAWLRFRKKCFIVCTESSYPKNADILGYDGKYLYEIEVKRSFSDFKADFSNKRKHMEQYNTTACIGNYFYFLVTEKILAKCEVYLKDYPKYGLIVGRSPEGEYRKDCNYCDVIKRAARLHDKVPSPKAVKDLSARCSSELINMRLTTHSLNDHFSKLNNLITDKLWEVLVDEESEESGSVQETKATEVV